MKFLGLQIIDFKPKRKTLVRIKMRVLILLAILSLLSCSAIFLPAKSDNAWYSVQDCSIRLIVKHNLDTLYKTAYELNYNLPGKYYPLLSTTEKANLDLPKGVQIKLWTKIIMNQKGGFYGNFPKNGLLEKIDSLTIFLTNNFDTLDITHYLKGDSTIKEMKWRECNYKKLPYSWGDIPYFENIDSWVSVMNAKSSSLKRIPNHDYIFWINKKIINNISFKPTTIQINLTLIDSLGIKKRFKDISKLSF